MENAVKYKIFIKDGESFVREINLEARLANYLAFLSPLINDLIWQNEPFHLVVRPDKGLYTVRKSLTRERRRSISSGLCFMGSKCESSSKWVNEKQTTGLLVTLSCSPVQ